MAISEWDHRELCPEGSCTGLIGPDGLCKVCGRAAANWGEERTRGLVEDPEAEDEDDDVSAATAATAAPGAPAWTERSLCPDGACIGLIGPDGTCKVCGKTGVPGPAAAEADADEAEADGEPDDEDEDDEDDEDDEYDDEDDDDLAAAREDDDEDDGDELAAVADELAAVATPGELASTDQLASTVAADDDDRKLCPDGACIGVIGPDGKCKVCGKAAA